MSLRELDNYFKENLTIDERKKFIQYVILKKYLIENGILSPSQLIEQKVKLVKKRE